MSSLSIGAASLLRREWPLLASVVTAGVFLVWGGGWLAAPASPAAMAGAFVWLFAAILLSAFAIVRHAESLAHLLGEPYGTLVLTLSVIGVEVLMISAVMLTGGEKPAMARDTMVSVVMILLGGMTGVALLLGGLRHHEQTYNLQGANAYLALIIPLAVLGLVLPNYTTTTLGPMLSPFQSVFTSLMSVGIYGIFLAVQTNRHRDFFLAPPAADAAEPEAADVHDVHPTGHPLFHAALLLAYILPLVVLAKKLAIPLDYGVEALRAPPALSGFVVAVLILAPEAISAVRAAVRNELQRSVNILLGSVLATIGLTIPAVLSVGIYTGQAVHLGLDVGNTVLLLLLLFLSTITFSASRTNLLLGAVHLLVFFAYGMLMFEG